MLPREVVLASHNPGKIAEFERLLTPFGMRVIAPFGTSPDLVEETGTTYRENARLKAVHIAREMGLPTLADDSGLEVDALNGAPGIDTAHFVSDVPWENNREILLRLMETPAAERGAKMVAVLVLVDATGEEIASSEGVVAGTILTWPKGERGFGVDPIFSVDGIQSLAEWTADQKDAWSHRGRAVRDLIERFGPVASA